MKLRDLAHLEEPSDGKMRKKLKVQFPGMDKRERIVLFFRRHPLSFFNFALIGSIMIILPIVVILMVYSAGFFVFEGELSTKIAYALASAYLLFVMGLMLVAWMNFYLDIYIVTNRRLIDISQEGLFSRNLSGVDLADIEDVKADVQGLLPTYFNFGHVNVQTAGELQNVNFIDVPEPYKLARKIMEEKEKLMERQSAQAVKKVAEQEKEAEKAIEASEEMAGREKNTQPKQKDQSQSVDNNEEKEDTQREDRSNRVEKKQNDNKKINRNGKKKSRSISSKELEEGGSVDL